MADRILGCVQLYLGVWTANQMGRRVEHAISGAAEHTSARHRIIFSLSYLLILVPVSLDRRPFGSSHDACPVATLPLKPRPPLVSSIDAGLNVDSERSALSLV
jgi:hypothetical protein